jgi:hypothetical protein
MRRVIRFIACFVTGLSVSACDPVTDRQYFTQGIGTNLAAADIGTTTELQNIYLDYLCRQTLPYVGADVPSCSQQTLAPGFWPLIVQAGMNDIDQRCDSYLAWLDERKRETAAVLTEISAIRVAVDLLVNPTLNHGVGPRTLAAVAAAFGLATSTFNNFNSLLLQVDHSTVQAVVFGRRKDYRLDLKNNNVRIDNKPAAVHALRSYLEICTPITIATEINLTVSVYQQAGARALERNSLIDSATIRSMVITDATRPITTPIQGPRDTGPHRFGRVEGALRPNEIRKFQALVCAKTDGDLGDHNSDTRKKIIKFLADKGVRKNSAADDRITANDRDTLRDALDNGETCNPS